MDIVAIERDLTAFLAGKLQKNVDADIFRSQIPTGRNGLGVMIEKEMTYTAVSAKTYAVQIFGKYPDRDTAMCTMSQLTGLFPANGILLGSGKILSWGIRGDGAVWKEADDGISQYCLSLNTVLVLLTTGSQVHTTPQP